MIEFHTFPKIARYSRTVWVSEKIDGTNSQVLIAKDDMHIETPRPVAQIGDLLFYAGSRARFITPDDDHFGFAAWVRDNSEQLAALGSGRHFGEWWGNAINRGYGLPRGERRFSMFNFIRWCSYGHTPGRIETGDPRQEKYQEVLPPCVSLVPVLWLGNFDDLNLPQIMQSLKDGGSVAQPGFMRPEGVVVYHAAANTAFKKTFEKDNQPKGKSDENR